MQTLFMPNVVHVQNENLRLQLISEPIFHTQEAAMYLLITTNAWGKGVYRVFMHFFSVLSEPESCEMPRISFACICPGWQAGALSSNVHRLGWQRVRQHLRALTKSYGRQKQRLLCSTCYLRESAALPSPSSFPASPGSAEITFRSRSAHARLSIELGKGIP